MRTVDGELVAERDLVEVDGQAQIREAAQQRGQRDLQFESASWLILPIRSRDIARKRIGEARRAIAALRAGEQDARDAVHRAIAQLDLIAPAFETQRRLHRLIPGSRRDKPFLADTFDAIRAEFSRVDHAGSR